MDMYTYLTQPAALFCMMYCERVKEVERENR